MATAFDPSTIKETEKIAAESPDGIPASPKSGPKQITTLLILIAGFFLAAAILAAIFINVWIGAVVLSGCIALIVVAPTFTVAGMRAEERRRINASDEIDAKTRDRNY
ncbi:MAG: hypothetical protein AAGI17_05180 [Planctomycetota bacterium]